MHIPHLHLNIGTNKLNLLLLEEDWSGAIAECEYHKREAKIWSSRPGFFDGDHESSVLPVHVACNLGASRNVIDAILLAYPQGIKTPESSFKRLPIHIACKNAARTDVIDLLLNRHPGGAVEPDNLGRLPIHYACFSGATLEVVASLLTSNPGSAMCVDSNGWNVLHVACHCGASTEVIREILRVCPGCVHSVTRKGSTPLMLANKIASKNKANVIALLEAAADVDLLLKSGILARTQSFASQLDANMYPRRYAWLRPSLRFPPAA